jgi:hypothetical protein
MAGRPKKADAERRDSVLRIRLTDAERRVVDRAARGKGLDVSAWARMTMLAATRLAEPRRPD